MGSCGDFVDIVSLLGSSLHNSWLTLGSTAHLQTRLSLSKTVRSVLAESAFLLALGDVELKRSRLEESKKAIHDGIERQEPHGDISRGFGMGKVHCFRWCERTNYNLAYWSQYGIQDLSPRFIVTYLMRIRMSFASRILCVLTPFDRVFRRIGANGNFYLAGQSTFIVELAKTSRILGEATLRSLVILQYYQYLNIVVR
ncbi:hypothetical protein SeLEV6574_g07761 [Synchytrium endobioticum]|uniref:DNA mismatch repair proteins mutS family domain-containing protein n=1 Tax=Synchytrium endobioticum TaxID=286115 RepID=A0A507CBQ7_9FUNG|nr:hypothetical protein SeLEV6574_g07761 [Synchytrium endobioticum]